MIYIYTALLFLACFLLLGCFCALRAERGYRLDQRDRPLDYERGMWVPRSPMHPDAKPDDDLTMEGATWLPY